MQGSTGQGNQNGQQKQGGLSWTQSPSAGASNNNQQGGMKPLSQTTPSVMPIKGNQPATSSNTSNKNMPPSSMKKPEATTGTSGAKLTSIFLAGVAVGLIIGWGWSSLGKNQDTATVTPTSTATSSTQTQGTAPVNSGTNTATQPVSSGTSGALAVATQAAGVQVDVSNISVSVPTWIAIFENASGKSGNVIGAQMFFPGQSTGTIELLRATVAGQTYFAGEFVDNGDHTFSKQQDMQVSTVAGSPLLVQFKVQ